MNKFPVAHLVEFWTTISELAGFAFHSFKSFVQCSWKMFNTMIYFVLCWSRMRYCKNCAWPSVYLFFFFSSMWFSMLDGMQLLMRLFHEREYVPPVASELSRRERCFFSLYFFFSLWLIHYKSYFWHIHIKVHFQCDVCFVEVLKISVSMKVVPIWETLAIVVFRYQAHMI